MNPCELKRNPCDQATQQPIVLVAFSVVDQYQSLNIHASICGQQQEARASRGKVIDKPIVLIAAHMEVCIVGQKNHVGGTHIDRVPQWAAGSASFSHDGCGEA